MSDARCARVSRCDIPIAGADVIDDSAHRLVGAASGQEFIVSNARTANGALSIAVKQALSESQPGPYVEVDTGFTRVRAAVAEIHRSNERIQT
jgi:hypothetical protein